MANADKPLYDLAILGGGPAGAAAGVYAARKRLKTVFITKDWNGQSAVSEGIENWIGDIKISGLDLSKKLEKHLKAYAKDIIDIKEGEWVIKVQSSKFKVQNVETKIEVSGTKKETNGKEKGAGTHDSQRFIVITNKASYEARTILIATGSSRRKLEVPGAEKYDNKGVTYCATCDGPLYADQDVAVVGGGNAGFESAAQLAAYCKSVTLLARSDFRADPETVEKVSANPKVKLVSFAVPKEVKGGKFVTSLVYTNTKINKDVELPVTGIFVEIGSIPNTAFAKDVVKLDKFDRIPVDAKNQRAVLVNSGAGVWAAGDCTDGLYHQNNIAAGDAVKALEDIYNYLRAK